jgi:hypothetical protein
VLHMSDDNASHWIQALAKEIAERAAADLDIGIDLVDILRSHIISVLLEERYRNLPELDIKIAIARLNLKPSDVLVVKTNQRLTAQQAKDLGNRVKQFLPDNEVMLTSWGIDIALKELDWVSV